MDQWFPPSGRDPNQGPGASDVGSREGFLENSIIIKKITILSKFKQNDRENLVIESVFINFKHSRPVVHLFL